MTEETKTAFVDATSSLADEELDDVNGGVIRGPGQGGAPGLDTWI